MPVAVPAPVVDAVAVLTVLREPEAAAVALAVAVSVPDAVLVRPAVLVPEAVAVTLSVLVAEAAVVLVALACPVLVLEPPFVRVTVAEFVGEVCDATAVLVADVFCVRLLEAVFVRPLVFVAETYTDDVCVAELPNVNVLLLLRVFDWVWAAEFVANVVRLPDDVFVAAPVRLPDDVFVADSVRLAEVPCAWEFVSVAVADFVGVPVVTGVAVAEDVSVPVTVSVPRSVGATLSVEPQAIAKPIPKPETAVPTNKRRR